MDCIYDGIYWRKMCIRDRYIWLFGINALVASALFFILFLFAHAKDGINIEYVMGRTAEFVGKTVEEIENHRPTINDFLFRSGGDGGIRCLIQSWGFLIVGMLSLIHI